MPNPCHVHKNVLRTNADWRELVGTSTAAGGTAGWFGLSMHRGGLRACGIILSAAPDRRKLRIGGTDRRDHAVALPDQLECLRIVACRTTLRRARDDGPARFKPCEAARMGFQVARQSARGFGRDVLDEGNSRLLIERRVRSRHGGAERTGLER